ncbi:MAG: hypothetical protein HQ521_04075 [Bacteroidetes bacterium]|nr:hypothetical protein [Bacteroidota bacterium]
MSKRIGIVVGLILFVLTACEKTDELQDSSIEGTYFGILSEGSGLKSASGAAGGDHGATADVRKTGEGQIEIHCYGGEFDTTFMLNYFENHDSIMVCLEGENFQAMYGHMMGNGHMSGGMMGNHSNNGTGWANHMNGEHQQGDEHFGGFDRMGKTFGYTFKMESGDLHFQGVKK